LATDTSITGFMRDFRECARHVWNTYFQPLEDGWHAFINVEHELFDGLALNRIALASTESDRHPDGYYAIIGVVPELPPIGLPVMYEDPQPGSSTVTWAEARLTSVEFDMRYIGFFDFANDQDPRDFRYVRVRVLGGPDPLYIGKDVLLEMPSVAFVRRTVP
jgi:hypothetical protein